MKVYIVTAGQYSDFHIDEVFSSEEVAQKYVDMHQLADNTVGYNEWEVDNIDLDKEYIQVIMKSNGDTVSNYRVFSMEKPNFDYTGSILKLGNEIAATIKTITSWNLINTVETDSIKTAVKVTNELRTRLLANNLWGINEYNTR